jgi:hypothetical protein
MDPYTIANKAFAGIKIVYNTKNNMVHGSGFEPPAHMDKSVDELILIFTHLRYDIYTHWTSHQEPPSTYFKRCRTVVEICNMAIIDLKGIYR